MEPDQAVLNYAEHLSNGVLGTILVCTYVIMVRTKIAHSPDETIKAGPIEVRREKFWVLVFVATIFHGILASYFVSACDKVNCKAEAIREATRNELTDGDPILFAGVGRMEKLFWLPVFGNFRGISSWLTRFLFFLMIFIMFLALARPKREIWDWCRAQKYLSAVIPDKPECLPHETLPPDISWNWFLIYNGVAVFFCVVNQQIGTQWVIAAANLFEPMLNPFVC